MTVDIRFDPNQEYQREAIDAVVELFAGQEVLDQGLGTPSLAEDEALFEELVFGNTLGLSAETIRRNLRRIQDRPTILEDGSQVAAVGEPLRREVADGEMPTLFNVEMETGTGKTYVYLRTIAELHLKYGFRKFLIVVPSIAIREGVLNSLSLLRAHVRELYDGLQYDYYVYDGAALGRVRQFATASHLQIMVINIAAMTGDANTRLIHRRTDALNGYGPIEFLRACQPIVIMDEPQSLDGPTQIPAIETLRPLFRVGYSATPPDGAHLVHRLTPVDAYNKRLVKRIGVYSLTKDADLNEAFVEVVKITASPGSVTATAVIHKATKQGTKPTRVTLRKDDDLHELSGHRDVYKGWTVEDIHAANGFVEFANGRKIAVGATGSDADEQQQRLMLRQAIVSHFEKELQLFLLHRRDLLPAPMKPLTLFFIEKVADYHPEDAKLRGWFVEEYESVRNDARFRAVAAQMPSVAEVHDGYFAEAKGVPKDAQADSKDAAGAFERIMRHKEELLGFDEPLRFIFSHSALAEGWDNPNVFTICNLQEGKSVMRKRQQVGRGLRLPVMTNGDRCHHEDVNLLTVVAKESFSSFAEKLQKEIEEETGVTFTGRIVNMREKKAVTLKEEVLESQNFKDLWERISPLTSYRLSFDTDEVVTTAVERINNMPNIEKAKFHLAKGVVAIGSAGVGSGGTIDLGSIESETAIKVPDVVRELSRRLPLSRATIVRVLKTCGRLHDVKANPAVFIDQVADCINRALYEKLTESIAYTPSGKSWPASMFRDSHQDETVAPRVLAVERSVVDMIVCDSEVEEKFALFLDGRKDDIPLFLKLPDWYKVPTPLGNYNPDWAFIRLEPTGPRLYLVRETKGGSDIEKLRWESEGWKIRFGEAHFNAINVDYAFGHDPLRLIEPSEPHLT